AKRRVGQNGVKEVERRPIRWDYRVQELCELARSIVLLLAQAAAGTASAKASPTLRHGRQASPPFTRRQQVQLDEPQIRGERFPAFDKRGRLRTGKSRRTEARHRLEDFQVVRTAQKGEEIARMVGKRRQGIFAGILAGQYGRDCRRSHVADRRGVAEPRGLLRQGREVRKTACVDPIEGVKSDVSENSSNTIRTTGVFESILGPAISSQSGRTIR